MAKSNITNIGKSTKTQSPANKNSSWSFPLSKMNMYYLFAGLGVILLGFALMATGISEEAATVEGTWNNTMAITIAPILLIIGYCVLIPLGLLKKFNKSDKTEEQA